MRRARRTSVPVINTAPLRRASASRDTERTASVASAGSRQCPGLDDRRAARALCVERGGRSRIHSKRQGPSEACGNLASGQLRPIRGFTSRAIGVMSARGAAREACRPMSGYFAGIAWQPDAAACGLGSRRGRGTNRCDEIIIFNVADGLDSSNLGCYSDVLEVSPNFDPGSRRGRVSPESIPTKEILRRSAGLISDGFLDR